MTITEDNDLTGVTTLSRNSVLKTSSQVTEAKKHLKALNLFLHHDSYKSWDSYKMIEIICKTDRNSSYSTLVATTLLFCPCSRLGFRNLYGCDLVLRPRYKRNFMNILYSLYQREYKPIEDMHNDKPLKLSIQSLEATNYQNNMFDFVTSLSVIEHGVDIEKYFIEMNGFSKKMDIC